MTAIKTNYAVLVICILSFLNTANRVNGFSKDSTCGRTHGCWGDCDGGCSFLLTWTPAGSGVTFTMKVALSSDDDQWAGFGLSASSSMPDSSVTSCLMTNSTLFTPENSYNWGRANIVVTNPTNGLTDTSASYNNGILMCSLTRSTTNSDPKVFDLTPDYYILFAKGTISGVAGNSKSRHSFTAKSSSVVDLQSTKDLSGGPASDVTMIKPFTSRLVMLSVTAIVLFSM